MGLFREKRMCATCETVGYSKTRERGSTGVELMLWLFFLLPGLIYSLWRRSTKYSVCRTCGSTTLMPLHTAGAQRRLGAQEVLVAELVDQRTPVVESRSVRDGSTSGWLIALGCFVAAWFVVAGIVCGSPRSSVRIEGPSAQSASVAPASEPAAKPKPKKSAKKSNKAAVGRFSDFASPEKLVAMYGDPDTDDSTAYDNPRPPLVTRKLEYEKERVRAWYVPGGGATPATEPPYAEWTFFTTQDPQTDQPISIETALLRLRRRERSR